MESTAVRRREEVGTIRVAWGTGYPHWRTRAVLSNSANPKGLQEGQLPSSLQNLRRALILANTSGRRRTHLRASLRCARASSSRSDPDVLIKRVSIPKVLNGLVIPLDDPTAVGRSSRPESMVSPAPKILPVDIRLHSLLRSLRFKTRKPINGSQHLLGILHKVLITHDLKPADRRSVLLENLVASYPVSDQQMQGNVSPLRRRVGDGDRMAEEDHESGIREKPLEKSSTDERRGGLLDQDRLV